MLSASGLKTPAVRATATAVHAPRGVTPVRHIVSAAASAIFALTI